MADKHPSSTCPVDPQTRDVWLSQARAAAEASTAQPPSSSSSSSSASSASSSCPVTHHSPTTPNTWTQSLASYLPWPRPSSPTSSPQAQPSSSSSSLDTNRVISTIPRSAVPRCPVDDDKGASSSSGAANHEIESGLDPSGRWVYPSEKMFFDAMRRKGYDARAADMKTVVPIHNAVNERAWQQIREWEAPYLSQANCDGPKLDSFANKNDRMTPTARLNTILGYTAPFDRHDWVIDRCGTRVDYVIDFYAGRPGAAGGRPGPSFYLDVRPKLNTWEGVKMRAMRWAGLA
ncbi:hypothetical protein E4U41_001212 [Claviceps citrina]|nr:hypothetical protein E4U41_001212 [Claviceps citrina]